MRRNVGRALCVLLAWCAWAGAETLEEAIQRIDTASEGVKDLHLKSKMSMSNTMPQGKVQMDGTTDVYTLREGDKQLTRTVANMTTEMNVPGMPVPGGKRTTTHLTVNDGEFQWMQMQNPMTNQVVVLKMKPALGQGMGQPGVPGLSAGATRQSFKQGMEMLQKTSDLKLVGAGNVDGRPATTIEAALKPESIEKMPEQARAYMPVRTVIQFDDATGAPLAMESYNGKGEKIMTSQVTEIDVNKGLEKSLFQYTPPEGAQVQDMTQGATHPVTPPQPQ